MSEFEGFFLAISRCLLQIVLGHLAFSKLFPKPYVSSANIFSFGTFLGDFIRKAGLGLGWSCFLRTKLSSRDLALALTTIPAEFDIGWGFICEKAGIFEGPVPLVQFGNLVTMGALIPPVAGREGKRPQRRVATWPLRHPRSCPGRSSPVDLAFATLLGNPLWGFSICCGNLETVC